MDYDQNLHKCYVQMIIVGICKSQDGILINVGLASCYFLDIRIKGHKEYIKKGYKEYAQLDWNNL